MKKIAVLAGGNSGEYEISLKTGANIYALIDKSRYIPYFIHVKGITWTYTDDDDNIFEVDKNDFSLCIEGNKICFDVVFIAIHGTPGENGLFQGYFDMLNIPYTGCDCFCSALTFNKYFCNVSAAFFKVPVSPSLHYYNNDVIDDEEVKKVCGFPCFVKPCNSGSSVGVTKVHNQMELDNAVREAFKYDRQLMIEKFIPGRELTCGVAVVNGKICALAVTEITSKNEFYDYQSKYTDGMHNLITPADIKPAEESLIKHYSGLLFHRFGCKGVVRFDFILTPEGTPFFLEVNTIPGQTSMSIIPCQLKYRHIELSDFYSSLIEEATN